MHDKKIFLEALNQKLEREREKKINFWWKSYAANLLLPTFSYFSEW